LIIRPSSIEWCCLSACWSEALLGNSRKAQPFDLVVVLPVADALGVSRRTSGGGSRERSEENEYNREQCKRHTTCRKMRLNGVE
jgi:hypothetical protein